MTNIITPKSKSELKKIIEKEIKLNGNDVDLNHIDVSNIDDMTGLFEHSHFNGDISLWNVSKVKKMTGMFYKSSFNNDISRWDVRNVKEMDCMFLDSEFTGDLTIWKPYKAEVVANMFENDIAPYWSNIDDPSHRTEEIKKYLLKNKLNPAKNTPNKKKI